MFLFLLPVSLTVKQFSDLVVVFHDIVFEISVCKSHRFYLNLSPVHLAESSSLCSLLTQECTILFKWLVSNIF